MSDQEQSTGFTAVQALKTITVEGVRLYTEDKIYPVIETYPRGNHIINEVAFYFPQTTMVVINDAGERCYIPYTSGNFSKKRSAVVAEAAV